MKLNRIKYLNTTQVPDKYSKQNTNSVKEVTTQTELNGAAALGVQNMSFIKNNISFGSMKKNQFSGIDLAVIEKFNIPIEKFDTNDDFQKWCQNKIKTEILNVDFIGKREEINVQRKNMLQEWYNYVLKENEAYSSAAALLILKSITKDLKSNNDTIPPVLNKGVLADCISEIDKNIKADKKYKFNFNKMYETKLLNLYFEDTEIKDGGTGWVIIPSKSHDSENFDDNVNKLKVFSHKNWCTKSLNAEPYLSKGDFHIYLEDGKPKIGVRLERDKVVEIEGELNNQKIPVLYLDEVKSHIEENNLQLGPKPIVEIREADKIKDKIIKIKKDLKTAIETNDAKAIFEYFGIKVKEQENGLLSIGSYAQPDKDFGFFELGINENKLLKKVERIESELFICDGWSGCANFKGSGATNLGSIKYINGLALFEDSQINDLGNLEAIGGDACFNNSKITDLKNLKYIGGDAYFNNSEVVNLGNLKEVEGDVRINNSKFTTDDFKNVRYHKLLSKFDLKTITWVC